MWPTNVASITLPTSQVGTAKLAITNVGNQPLQPSPRRVKIAGILPPIRNTLVAPGLFEPLLRGSGKPHNLQIIMALDNDPIK